MKNKQLVRVFLLYLSTLLVLTSCGEGKMVSTQETQTENGAETVQSGKAVEMSFYAINFSADATGEVTTIEPAGLDASLRTAKDYMVLMKSEYVLSQVIDQAGVVSVTGALELSLDEVRTMMSMETVDETAMIRVRFTSEDYTEEQLLKIAKAFMVVAPDAVMDILCGVGRLTAVDYPHIVE